MLEGLCFEVQAYLQVVICMVEVGPPVSTPGENQVCVCTPMSVER